MAKPTSCVLSERPKVECARDDNGEAVSFSFV